MASKGCEATHQLQGSKVLRTTHTNNLLLRERRCINCGEKIMTVEQGQREMEDVRREREESERATRENGRKLELLVYDMERAIREMRAAREKIWKYVEENKE